MHGRTSNVDQPMMTARVRFVYDPSGYDPIGLPSAAMRAIVGYLACLSNAVLSSALFNGRLVWYMHLFSNTC